MEVKKIKIWKHWKYDDKKKRLMPGLHHSKWVTSTTTYGNRPSQITNIKNLFLGGAHTNTTTKLWSMEGAVESGKLVVIAINKQNMKTKNVPYFSHDIGNIAPFGIIRETDNVLFRYGLPNVLYFILLIIFILIIIISSMHSLNIKTMPS